mgnify:CR=1 FL=1
MDERTLRAMTRGQLLAWAVQTLRKLEAMPLPDLPDPTRLAEEEEEPDHEIVDDEGCTDASASDDDDGAGTVAELV